MQKLDFLGRPIIRPSCPQCKVELVWQGDPCNGPLGYECPTVGCANNGKGAIA